MRDEGWKGADALNGPNLASAFWDQVADKRNDMDDLEVGDFVTIETNAETYRRVQYGIVTRRWIGDDGLPKMQFRVADTREVETMESKMTFVMKAPQ